MQSLLSNNMQSLSVQLKAPHSAPWNTVIICILFSRVLGRWLVPRFSNCGWKFQSPIEYLTLGYIRSFAGYEHYSFVFLRISEMSQWHSRTVLKGKLDAQLRFSWDNREDSPGTRLFVSINTLETKQMGQLLWDEALSINTREQEKQNNREDNLGMRLFNPFTANCGQTGKLHKNSLISFCKLLKNK